MEFFEPLSSRDISVLGKIRDPESNTAGATRIDASLPKDPHVTDPQTYERISQLSRELVMAMQQVDLELAGQLPKTTANPVEAYRKCIARLDTLIDEHPAYAGARNNRAQALRRLYGDDMLLERESSKHELESEPTVGLDALLHRSECNAEERAAAAATVLSDLDRCVELLVPNNPFAALSPTAVQTLSAAFTQRAIVYLVTSKLVGPSRKTLQQLDRPESQWSMLDFQEAASRDFAMGGRFGNEMARRMAVATNPTAKLCGQMVQQMMQTEYGIKK